MLHFKPVKMKNKLNRRKFVQRSAASLGGFVIGSRLSAIPDTQTQTVENEASGSADMKKYDLMEDVMKYRKIDTHAHIYFTDNSPKFQLDSGRKMGIEKQVISRYLSVMPGTPEQFREYNDLTIKAIKQYPWKK